MVRLEVVHVRGKNVILSRKNVMEEKKKSDEGEKEEKSGVRKGVAPHAGGGDAPG